MAAFVTLSTPISDTALVLVSLHGDEAVSQPFEYTLVLRSTVANVDATTVLGQPIVITLTNAEATPQIINGVAVEFTQEATDSTLHTYYTVRLRPSFWLLSLHSDYQIFQAKSVIDILSAVFSAQGFTDFKNSTTGTYTALDYVVQYGESTLDFVSRLMESSGIFYFFEHTSSACTLVLADDASAYGKLPGTGTIPYARQPGSGDRRPFLEGSLQQRLVPTSYRVADYNFTAPAPPRRSPRRGAPPDQRGGVPGKYVVKAPGDALAALRLSAHESDARLLRGRSACSTFHAGYSFTVSGHPNTAANAAWTLLSLTIRLDGDIYENEYVACPATVTFRPRQVTPRPRIHGTQTALVTGKSGEEIWTDSYGRVKVKFHWDSTSASDETTSCWVRVAQVWAGKAWGGLSTPRIGSEVVISFLDGDPDQPLVIGSVYNADQTLPYTLPADQTKTTMKTYSSKGGAGFNELRFEDKAGSEEVFLQAQQDMNVNVVKGNYGLAIATGNETHSTKGTRAITVEGKETRTNKADFQHDITGKTAVTCTGDEKHTNSANFEQDVSGNYTLNVTGNLVIKATGSVDIESGTGFTIKAGTSLAVSSTLDTSVKATTQLALEGSVTAELKGAASAAIKGGIVQIN